MRLIDFVSLNLRLKDFLGPVARVKKKQRFLLTHAEALPPPPLVKRVWSAVKYAGVVQESKRRLVSRQARECGE